MRYMTLLLRSGCEHYTNYLLFVFQIVVRKRHNVHSGEALNAQTSGF